MKTGGVVEDASYVEQIVCLLGRIRRSFPLFLSCSSLSNEVMKTVSL
jgi:hypothetical protein